MSATASKPKSVRVDRDALARLMVEVHALACFEMIRFGSEETSHSPVTEHIHGILSDFERATNVRDLSDDEEGMRLHGLAWDNARELQHQILEVMMATAKSAPATVAP